MSAAVSHAALTVAAALFDGLWEGALIAGAVWIGLRCLPALGAATRYAIWLCALAAIVLVPVLTASLSERQPAPPLETAATTAQRSDDAVRQRIAPTANAAPAHAASGAQSPTANETTQTPPQRETPDRGANAPALAVPRKPQITISHGLAAAVALAWLLIACARALLLLLDVRALAAIRRDARPWPAACGYPVFLSDRVQVPFAAGFVHAAIVLPASLVEQLEPAAVETIVIHEVAHLRRRDVWTNAFARAAETLLSLNPAAWFVMRRLATEREIACDDWVVSRTGSGDAFAHTLAAMASRGACRAPLAAPSAFGSRHALVVRIERLLDARPRRLRLSPTALGGALVLLAIVALVIQSVSPVLAYAPQTNAVAQVAAAGNGAGCAVPDHGIQLIAHPVLTSRPHAKVHVTRDVPSARDVIARAGTADVATFDLTVDASGRPRKVTLVSAPRYPGVADDVVHLMMINRFTPATRNCVAITSTVRTAMALGQPQADSSSDVVPVYPAGWSAAHPASCKVPSLDHTGIPAFPDALKNVPVGTHYVAAVRVHVDPAGAATNAVLVTASGRKAFDDALLAAARETTYPMTENTGFKPVRPSGASLAWNAAHGSAAYARCTPLPTDYVWTTTFERHVPMGFVAASASFKGPHTWR